MSILNMEEVYLNTTKSIKIYKYTSKNPEEVHLENHFERIYSPIHPNCIILEMNTSAVPSLIKIALNNSEKVSFQMDIVEKNMGLTKRRIESYAYSGPTIKLDKLDSKGLAIGLSLKQTYYSEQDKETNCIIYPNKTFKSFKDCDEHFIINEMKKLDIMSFWAINNQMYHNVTRSK